MGAPGDPKHGYIFSNAILGLKEAEIAKNVHNTNLLGRKSPGFTFTVVRIPKFQCYLLFWRSNVRKFEKNAQNSKKLLFPSKKSFMNEWSYVSKKKKISTLNLHPLSCGKNILSNLIISRSN